MKRRTRSSRPLAAVEVGIVVCVFIFLVGLIWGFLGMGARKNAYRSLLIAQRTEAGMPAYSDQELMRLKELKANLSSIPAETKDPQLLNVDTETAASVSGIGLTSAIQSFLNEYRQLFESKSILLEDRNFGFSDYVREVAVISNPDELRLLELQLSDIKELLQMLSEASPIALISVKRLVERTEIPGLEEVDPITGIVENAAPSFRHRIRVEVIFDAYTRSFRAFLNALSGDSSTFSVKEISVRKSDRSELDRTVDLLDGDVSNTPQRSETERSSPFAAYLQAEQNEETVEETEPLIGEVVSRFSIVCQRGGQR